MTQKTHECSLEGAYEHSKLRHVIGVLWYSIGRRRSSQACEVVFVDSFLIVGIAIGCAAMIEYQENLLL